MPFLNFFTSFSHKSLVNLQYPKGIQAIINSYTIFLDNPNTNAYFPFKKVKIVDSTVVKLIVNNLTFLENFKKTDIIFINYNKVNCNINYEDFNIKSLHNYESLVEWLDQDIDITLLKKPVLIKLGDNRYFFDFEINQKFLDS